MSKNSHPVCTSKSLMSSDTMDKSSAHWKNICTFLNVWTTTVLNQWVPLLWRWLQKSTRKQVHFGKFKFSFAAYQDRTDHHLPSTILYTIVYHIFDILCLCPRASQPMSSLCQPNICFLCCSAICRGQVGSEGSGRWSWEADICVTFLMWPLS